MNTLNIAQDYMQIKKFLLHLLRYINMDSMQKISYSIANLIVLFSINKGDIIVDYPGEIIRNAVADKREHQYESIGVGSCYMFRLNDRYVIDATFSGNEARFLNHSCNVRMHII